MTSVSSPLHPFHPPSDGNLPVELLPKKGRMQLLHDEVDGLHRWAVVSYHCDLTDPQDAFIGQTVQMVRDAYGESEIIALAESTMPIPESDIQFDVSRIVSSFRLGLPDPEQEGDKKRYLTNYRSEVAELVAQRALSNIFYISFPIYLQSVKINPNQPILGRDGWGFILTGPSSAILVLVQTKGSDQADSPPSVATDLAKECIDAEKGLPALCRGLSVLALRVAEDLIKSIILRMLEGIQLGQLPPMVIAPVLIRGSVTGSKSDLQPVRDVVHKLSTPLRGVVVNVGVDLADLGWRVMTDARAA